MDIKRDHKILIISNSEIEFKYIQETFSDVKSLDERRAEFLHNSKKCLILRSDPGICGLSYFLTRELSAGNFELVINAGIGSSFTDKIDIASSVRVKSDVFADTGAEDGKTLFDLGLTMKDDFPFQNGELYDHPGKIKGIDEILPAVRAVTVNRISQSYGNIAFLKTKFRPDIESMEGAAFFYVCAHERVNFIQIRGISNMVGDINNREIQKAMIAVGKSIASILK